MKTDEATEWFNWSIYAGTDDVYVREIPERLTVYKLFEQVGRQTTDGKLTSIVEVRRLEFRMGGFDTADITALKALVYLLSRSPGIPRQRGAPGQTFGTTAVGFHPQVYESIHFDGIEGYNHSVSRKIDYCEGGHTGLLIWNPNVYTHQTCAADHTLTYHSDWIFNLWCRIRMVPTEVYAQNQLAHATGQSTHTEDKTEEEHISDLMQTGKHARAAAVGMYEAAGQYVTEAAGSFISEYVTPVAIGAVTAYAGEVVREHLGV